MCEQKYQEKPRTVPSSFSMVTCSEWMKSVNAELAKVRSGQVLRNGDKTPKWIKVDTDKGELILNPPKNLKHLNLSIISIDADGNKIKNDIKGKINKRSAERFAKEISNLGDIYINDAFSVSHRSHASVDGITKFIPSYYGLQITEEINALKKITSEIKKPITLIIGGSKISTKIKIILIHEKEILGTCGGISNAINHFGNDDFLVLNADIFSDIDYVYFKKFKAPTIFAVKNDKNEMDYKVNIAVALYRMYMYDEAMEYYEEVKKAKPELVSQLDFIETMGESTPKLDKFD